MKKIFLFLSILLVLGVTSCIYDKVNEIEENTPDPPDPGPGPNPNPNPEEKNSTFKFLGYATFSGKVNTYSTIDMGPGNPFVKWDNTYNPGSKELNVGLFLKGETKGEALLQNHESPIFSGGNSECANTVTIKTSEERGVIYGYYPYQATVSGTVLSYSLSNVQDQSVPDSIMDSSLNKNMLMISGPSPSFPLNGGDANLYFKNVFSLLRFRVNMSQEMQLLHPIKRITVYVANKDRLETPLNHTLAGNYTIDLSKAPESSGYTGPVFSSSKNTITAELSNSGNLTMSLPMPSAWMLMNPIKIINSQECLVSIVELDNYKIISSHEINEFKPNTIYDIHIVANKSNTVTDYVSVYYPDEQASNSYVISQAGVCQIPLKTVSGTDLRGHSVDWLWASKEGGNSGFDISELIDPSSIVYDESSRGVRFRVGTDFGKFTKGNVVLALKNSSNEIVWTWHIWITDQPKDMAYENGKIFLDRNIGALSARMVSAEMDNYGFVYQWGRKDPFVGGDGSTNEIPSNILSVAQNNTIVNTRATWNPSGIAGWSVKESTVANEETIRKTPMQFVCNNSSPKERPADWLSVSNLVLWSATGKTDYDPCPYGYKVPDKNDLRSLHVETPSSLWYFNYKGNKYWEYYYYSAGDVTAWPSAGMRQGRFTSDGNNGAQLIYSGTNSNFGQCFYWTSSPVNIGALSGGSYRIHTVGDKLYSEDDYGDNADAYPIRCVKMP